MCLIQALEDIEVFAQNFTLARTSPAAKDAAARDLRPSRVPWIMIGGSYAGVRAAAMRARNSSTIFASWASSAPVEAKADAASYWASVERGLPRNCSADFAAVVKCVFGGEPDGSALTRGCVQIR
jgi:hypothetical protein